MYESYQQEDPSPATPLVEEAVATAAPAQRWGRDGARGASLRWLGRAGGMVSLALAACACASFGWLQGRRCIRASVSIAEQLDDETPVVVLDKEFGGKEPVDDLIVGITGLNKTHASTTETSASTTRTTSTTVSPAPLYEFYMYRANGPTARDYEFGNINTGNLDGVVWYLMNEVVTMYTDGTRCPRKFNISVINRYRVRTRATRELFEQNNMNFGTRFSFDFGRCMGRCFPDNMCSGSDDCEFHYDKFGFNVGCNNFRDKYPFPDGETAAPSGTWYALPLDGRCDGVPNGARDCTWSYEDAGFLTLEEIEAVSPNGPNCCPKERCTGFWENMFDEGAMNWRVQEITRLFGQKYTDIGYYVGPSQCDFNRDQWYTPDTDIWPPHDPWAKEDDEQAANDEQADEAVDTGEGNSKIGSEEWKDDSWNNKK